MTTHRERREARAERLREWAGKREAKAETASQQAHDMAGLIPFGQPILAGHHSQGRDERYRARIAGTMDRAGEHTAKAREMAGKAATIEGQLAESIFDDDPDAIDALRTRIVLAVAERDRIKTYNLSCRKGAPDSSGLDDRQRQLLLTVAQVGQIRANGAFPAYALTNLTARINRDRARLVRLGGE